MYPFPAPSPHPPPAPRFDNTYRPSEATRSRIRRAVYVIEIHWKRVALNKNINTHLVETWCISSSLAIHFSIALHVGFVRGFVLLTLPSLSRSLGSRCVTRRIKYRRRPRRRRRRWWQQRRRQRPGPPVALLSSSDIDPRTRLFPEGEWVLSTSDEDAR